MGLGPPPPPANKIILRPPPPPLGKNSGSTHEYVSLNHVFKSNFFFFNTFLYQRIEDLYSKACRNP